MHIPHLNALRFSVSLSDNVQNICMSHCVIFSIVRDVTVKYALRRVFTGWYRLYHPEASCQGGILPAIPFGTGHILASCPYSMFLPSRRQAGRTRRTVLLDSTCTTDTASSPLTEDNGTEPDNVCPFLDGHLIRV